MAFLKFVTAAITLMAQRHGSALGLVVPAPEAIEQIANAIRYEIKKLDLESGQYAVTLFLDNAYSGRYEALSPQFPREIIEVVIKTIQDDYPVMWSEACRELGLTANA
jgi:hypothetical protein